MKSEMKCLILFFSIGITFSSFAQDLSPTTKKGKVYSHEYYSFSYTEQYEQPEWTFHLVCKLCFGEEKRKNNFRPDKSILTGSAQLSDYKGSGYDRGHLVPAGDMTRNTIAMSESFFMSNMSPQDPSFNRGIWRKLESQIRKWSLDQDTIYVVTGPIIRSPYKKIGANDVAVPHSYFKALYFKNSGKMCAFILPNQGSKQPLSIFQCSIDKLELVSGLDFFHRIPNNLENRLESINPVLVYD